MTTTKGATSEVAQHIARVAARLFATQGFDATSVRTIVEEAGVTKPTLYYYFGSKEGLAQALLMAPMVALNDRLQKIVNEAKDPVQMLEETFEAHFEFTREDPDRSRFFFTLYFGPSTSGLVLEMDRFKSGIRCAMERVVFRAAESGTVDPERIEGFARACRALIITSTMDFLYRNEDLGPELPRRLVGDLLRGFGRPGVPVQGA